MEASLEDTGRGLTVRSDRRYLYSRIEPAALPDKIARTAPVLKRCIYFLPSPLLGYGLETLAGRIPDDSVILGIEASEELMALCAPHIEGVVLNHPKIRIVRVADRVRLHRVMTDLGPWRFRRVHRLDLNGGAALLDRIYTDLADFLIGDLSNYWRNRHGLGRLGRQWIRHAFTNLMAMERQSAEYRDIRQCRPTGLPVVVGAGPSLESAFRFIGNHRKELWLLATDTALPALRSAGLNPDALVILETQAWNMLDLHGSAGCGADVFADLTAYPPSVTYAGGRVYLLASRFADLDFLDRLDSACIPAHPMPPLGSVGLTAVEIALTVSDGPVLLTGLDFAYVPGKTHARGTSVHRWQISRSGRLDPLPGWEESMRRPRCAGSRNDGKKLTTDTVLQSYAALLSDRYSAFNRLHVLYPGGLKLGLPVVDEKQGIALVERWKTMESDMKPVTEPSPDTGSLLRTFLDGEHLRIRTVIDAWEALIDGRSDAAALVDALEGNDQIFADFPDEPPLPRGDQSFLVRAADRARCLLRGIDRLRQLSSSSVRRTERNAD